MLDHEATLDALIAAIEASAKARKRWDELTAAQVEPLVAWVCAAQTNRGRRRRIAEAIGVLSRPSYGPVQATPSDLLLRTGVEAPSWIAAWLNR